MSNHSSHYVPHDSNLCQQMYRPHALPQRMSPLRMMSDTQILNQLLHHYDSSLDTECVSMSNHSSHYVPHDSNLCQQMYRPHALPQHMSPLHMMSDTPTHHLCYHYQNLDTHLDTQYTMCHPYDTPTLQSRPQLSWYNLHYWCCNHS